jgi:hypothetical protein
MITLDDVIGFHSINDIILFLISLEDHHASFLVSILWSCILIHLIPYFPIILLFFFSLQASFHKCFGMFTCFWNMSFFAYVFKDAISLSIFVSAFHFPVSTGRILCFLAKRIICFEVQRYVYLRCTVKILRLQPMKHSLTIWYQSTTSLLDKGMNINDTTPYLNQIDFQMFYHIKNCWYHNYDVDLIIFKMNVWTQNPPKSIQITYTLDWTFHSIKL